MEPESPDTNLENNTENCYFYDFGTGRTHHQCRCQVGRSRRDPNQLGLIRAPAEHSLARSGKDHNKNYTSYTPVQGKVYPRPELSLASNVSPTIDNTSKELTTLPDETMWEPVEHKESNEIGGFGNDYNFWRPATEFPNPDPVPLPPENQGIFNSFYDQFTIPLPYYQRPNRDWAKVTASLPNLSDTNEVDTISTIRCRTPYQAFFQDAQTPPAVNWSSLKSPETPKISPSPQLSIVNLPLAAHQAVVDLFPELAETCGFFKAKNTPHRDEGLKSKGPAAVGASRIEQALLLPSIGSDNKSMGLDGNMSLAGSPGEKTFLPDHPTAEQPSEFPAPMVDQNLDHLPCSVSTISPRYLSKRHSPPMSPYYGASDFEEIKYEQERPFCGEPVIVGEEEMPGVDFLNVGNHFDSGLDDSEVGFLSSSPEGSPEPPKTPPSMNSLPLKIPSLDLGFSEVLIVPAKNQCAVQYSFSPQISYDPPRVKLISKGATEDKATKDQKELMKTQNSMLLHWRAQGVSYKSIKERLGIDEAESTLRGRLRTLTKPKSERVRRPQWMEEDILLLLEIVDPEVPNVKWKQVSETIVSLGGSYRFGPSTCKKQYVGLVADGRARPLTEGIGTVGKRSARKKDGKVVGLRKLTRRR